MSNPFVTAIWLNAIIFVTFAQKASEFDDWSDWHIGPSGVFLARSTYDDTNKNVTKN